MWEILVPLGIIAWIWLWWQERKRMRRMIGEDIAKELGTTVEKIQEDNEKDENQYFIGYEIGERWKKDKDISFLDDMNREELLKSFENMNFKESYGNIEGFEDSYNFRIGLVDSLTKQKPNPNGKR